MEVPLHCSLLENDLLIPVPSELPKQLCSASPHKITFQKQLHLSWDPALLQIMNKLGFLKMLLNLHTHSVRSDVPLAREVLLLLIRDLKEHTGPC